jgi:hypothetical protein
MGYHLAEIKKGVLGEFSKIKEEVEELEDSLNQNNKIMVLIELSDLLGAIDYFLKSNFTDITMNDLFVMMNATKRAFQTGARK